MTETPSPNTPEARTSTGEIKPVEPTQPTTQATQTTTSTSSDQPTTTDKAADGKPAPSLLDTEGEKDKSQANEFHGAPEKYETYKAPEGFEIDPKLESQANDIFRKMGLNQKAGQELVDFFSRQLEAEVKERVEAYQELRKEWATQTTADPEVGGKNLDQVKVNISRVLDVYPDQALVRDFKEKMNLTGAGDILSFVKIFNWMAVRLGEGGFVRGTNPSPVNIRNQVRPALAKAMFPNLPSASDGG